jgi:two-component system nitrogen regulation sensor histidine kinase NtrY
VPPEDLDPLDDAPSSSSRDTRTRGSGVPSARHAPPRSTRGGLKEAIPSTTRFGATARRITIAILVTAFLPLIAAVAVGKVTIDRLAALAVQPELDLAFRQSLAVYADLAAAMKEGMRHEGAAMAGDASLARAIANGAARGEIEGVLRAIASGHPRAVSLTLTLTDGGGDGDGDGAVVGAVERAPGGDETKKLTVRTPLAGDARHVLVAVLEAPGQRFAEQEKLAAFEAAYRELEGSSSAGYVERPYLYALTLVMLATIAIAIAAGAAVARPVSRGVTRLSEAFAPVAAGDLAPRVVFEGADELSALGRAFNRAIGELAASRARVEFLRHMGEWQKVARRLAHEIRNPLTPIQLSVQECQRRHAANDPDFSRVLATTVEVVEEEVGSLRRLVGRFARFARLPDPELEPHDLKRLLADQASHFAATEASSSATLDDEDPLAGVDVEFELPQTAMPVLADREMLHRALVNLVRNAAQAIREAKTKHGGSKSGSKSDATSDESEGHVRVRAGEDDDGWFIAVDDDGPGIAEDLRPSVFDPYVTTRREGTGLGLSIVKKIALDHGGWTSVGTSPEGGARVAIHLPRAEPGPG